MGTYKKDMTLAAALNAAMEAEGHRSTNAAAIAWSVSQPDLHRWASGERVPSDDKADLIARILKIENQDVLLLLAESRRQKKVDKHRIPELEAQLAAARAEVTKLKRRVAALERQLPEQ